MSREPTGTCGSCHVSFRYSIYHCGFSDAAYGYCDLCGRTALLSGWFEAIPREAGLKVHQPISSHTASLLKPCPCGGHFSGGAAPRCPHCLAELDAETAATYIEADAPGTSKGWRWQRNWNGIYCIVIEDRVDRDCWQE